MTTLHLKGSGLNYYFAQQMIKDHGPQYALDHSCGPMLKAVERVIVAMGRDLSTFTYKKDYQ